VSIGTAPKVFHKPSFVARRADSETARIRSTFRREILLAMDEIAKVGGQPDSIPGIESEGKKNFAADVAVQPGCQSTPRLYGVTRAVRVSPAPRGPLWPLYARLSAR